MVYGNEPEARVEILTVSYAGSGQIKRGAYKPPFLQCLLCALLADIIVSIATPQGFIKRILGG